jgi:threonine dehydratase
MTIVTHSSGNHAQAIALASKLRGVNAHIVMPVDAPVVKKQAVKGYGAQITECVNTKEVSGKWCLI